MSTDNSENFLVVLTKKTETQISLENRFNSLSEKTSQPQQGTSSRSTNQNVGNRQNGEDFQEDAITKIVETEDVTLIKDRRTTRTKIKIKEDTGTIAEVTIEEEIIVEETITGGTTVDNFQEDTAELVYFNNMIIKMLNLD